MSYYTVIIALFLMRYTNLMTADEVTEVPTMDTANMTSNETQRVPHTTHGLMTSLLDGYNTRTRPVSNHRAAVNVSIRLTLYQIVDVDEKEQSLVLYVWANEQWKDEMLAWDPEKFHGQRDIAFNLEDIWRPDTYLYNSVLMGQSTGKTALSAMMVEGDPLRAHITHLYPAIFRISCAMKIDYFPFDEQNCTLTFGSWSFDTTKLDFYAMDPVIKMDQFIGNSEWEVLSTSTLRQERKYNCCPNPYTNVFFNIIIRRKALYYLCHLIIPTLIIAIITIVGFFCPSQVSGDRGEKVTLGMTSLFAMSVYLLIVAEDMPTTSDVLPYIGCFYLGVIVFIMAGTIMTAVLIGLQQRGRYGHPVPKWLKRVAFGCCSRITILKPPPQLLDDTDDEMVKRREHLSKLNYYGNGNELNYYSNSNGINNASDIVTINVNKQSDNIVYDSDIHSILLKLDAIIDELKSAVPITPDEYSSLELEWEWIVNILEQFCLILFLVGLLIFTIIILLPAAFS